jgi:hypothetical protein
MLPSLTVVVVSRKDILVFDRNNLLEYKEKISTNGFPLFSLTIPL